MTNNNNHPITPPWSLIQQWAELAGLAGINERKLVDFANQAARWGAYRELEACCEWIEGEIGAIDPSDLRNARRPKPKSLAEEATEALARMWNGRPAIGDWDLVRDALERLQELEGQADD